MTTLRPFKRWIVQRPILGVLTVALMFVVVVPVWPYRPYCGIYSTTTFRALDGEMTPEFLEALDRALSRENIYHWRIGDSIYLHLLLAIDAGYTSNAQLQAVSDLVETDLGSYAGKALAGEIYQPPAYLTELYQQYPSLVFGRDCTFIRAVAFGEPPPPGYKPEPSPFDQSPD